MQISASLIRPVGQSAVDQQAIGDRSSVGNSRTGDAADAARASNLTLRAVSDAKKAEAMLLGERYGRPAQPAGESADPRSQRALAAYAALQQSAEREYVSSVLGIDEYV